MPSTVWSEHAQPLSPILWEGAKNQKQPWLWQSKQPLPGTQAAAPRLTVILAEGLSAQGPLTPFPAYKIRRLALWGMLTCLLPSLTALWASVHSRSRLVFGAWKWLVDWLTEVSPLNSHQSPMTVL